MGLARVPQRCHCNAKTQCSEVKEGLQYKREEKIFYRNPIKTKSNLSESLRLQAVTGVCLKKVLALSPTEFHSAEEII